MRFITLKGFAYFSEVPEEMEEEDPAVFGLKIVPSQIESIVEHTDPDIYIRASHYCKDGDHRNTCRVITKTGLAYLILMSVDDLEEYIHKFYA